MDDFDSMEIKGIGKITKEMRRYISNDLSGSAVSTVKYLRSIFPEMGIKEAHDIAVMLISPEKMEEIRGSIIGQICALESRLRMIDEYLLNS